MRSILSLFLAVFLFAAACTKEKDENKPYEAVMGAQAYTDGQTVLVRAPAVNYGRIYKVSIDLVTAVHWVYVDVKAGQTMGSIVYQGDKPSNPRILSYDTY